VRFRDFVGSSDDQSLRRMKGREIRCPACCLEKVDSCDGASLFKRSAGLF